MTKLLDIIQSSQAMAGRVLRYHAFPVIHKQSIGEHSHRVATLYIELFGKPSLEVIVYILYHDEGELYAGDTPFGVKRDCPDVKEASNHAEEIGLSKLKVNPPALTSEEWVKFKLADLLEMYEYASIELMQGNRFVLPILGNVKNGVLSFRTEFPKLTKIAMNWIEKKDNEYYD